MNPRTAVATIGLLAAALPVAPVPAGLPEGLDALKRKDYAAAAKELRPLAERGDPEAQFRIGLMLEHGAGYPQDKPQAVIWLRRAATQGHSAAQQELGVLHATGDGVAHDDVQAAAWFRKAAEQGNETAQFNLGLLYAKGAGVRRDSAEAIRWFRKSGEKGFAAAVAKIGIAYEVGEGVPKDALLAYTHYALAARSGAREFIAQRDAMAAKLAPAQVQAGTRVAEAWKVGQPLPTAVAMSPTVESSKAAAAAPPRAPDRCSASGALGGERFRATHCAVAFFADQRSVAIWFSESPITAEEAGEFRLSSYANATRDGKPRTLVQVMFCPGGGQERASAAAIRSIDLNTNHAKSALAGVQTVVEAPKDFKVETMTGEAKPGGALAGRIVGKQGSTSFDLDFAVTLPAQDAAAGMSCGRK